MKKKGMPGRSYLLFYQVTKEAKNSARKSCDIISSYNGGCCTLCDTIFVAYYSTKEEVVCVGCESDWPSFVCQVM